MHNGASYCIVATVPVSMHYGADMVLASTLISGPIFLADWVSQINPYIACIGGIMGLFIASVRVYEVIKELFLKKKQ